MPSWDEIVFGARSDDELHLALVHAKAPNRSSGIGQFVRRERSVLSDHAAPAIGRVDVVRQRRARAATRTSPMRGSTSESTAPNHPASIASRAGRDPGA